MAPHSSTLAWKIHGWRSLVGCSPCGCPESDMNEWLHFHFSLSCIGEGNGNPLQCSCLENPRDGEPGGLPSLGSRRVGRNWSNLAAAAAERRERRAWQPTPIFLPGECPWTEKSGGLQFMGLQRVGHDWATKHSIAERKEIRTRIQILSPLHKFLKCSLPLKNNTTTIFRPET